MKKRIALTVSLTCFAVLTAMGQTPSVADMNTRLRAEEAGALQKTTSELEKRRMQNMYAGRRDRLMDQLEKQL